VENFGTNWGIVAIVSAFGATVWGVVYSAVYEWAARKQSFGGPPNVMMGALGVDGVMKKAAEVLCYGKACYASTFWAMALCALIACGLWTWAWKGPGGWSKRGIAL
jgi:hypothetical protein